MQSRAPMTRWRAAGIHLLISIAVITSAAGLALLLWYPPSLFQVAGADRLLLVLAIIDVSIGPLLTLLVYRHGKRGMRFDLAVIALLQLAFFAYGVRVFWTSRPVFIVASVDRFELVFANQIDPADLARAAPPYQRLGYGRPRLVGLQLPLDQHERSELIFEELAGHAAEQQPRLYRDYAEVAPQLLRRARPVDELARSGAQARTALAETLRDLDLRAEAVRWLPLESSRGAAVQLLAARGGQPLATLAIDPWNVAIRASETDKKGHPEK